MRAGGGALPLPSLPHPCLSFPQPRFRDSSGLGAHILPLAFPASLLFPYFTKTPSVAWPFPQTSSFPDVALLCFHQSRLPRPLFPQGCVPENLQSIAAASEQSKGHGVASLVKDSRWQGGGPLPAETGGQFRELTLPRLLMNGVGFRGEISQIHASI